MEELSLADRRACQALLCPEAAPPTSSLILLVPPILRKRLSMIGSLRRRYTKASSRANIERSCFPSDGILVPYTCDTVRGIEGRDSPSARSPRTSRSSSSQSIERAITPRSGQVDGVDWNVAGAGVRLWLTARQQVEDDRGVDSTVTRSMHIDALKYMHAALPSDLTPAEADAISNSLPARVRDDVRSRQETTRAMRDISARDSNMLRCMVSCVVCSLIAVLLFLLPVLMALLNRLARYEREHQISERVLSNTVSTISALGERGLDVKDNIARFGTGRFGNAILLTGLWVFHGVVGGVNDALVRSSNTGRLQASMSLS